MTDFRERWGAFLLLPPSHLRAAQKIPILNRVEIATTCSIMQRKVLISVQLLGLFGSGLSLYIKRTDVKFYILFYLHCKCQSYKINRSSSGDPRISSFLLVICRSIMNKIKAIERDNNWNCYKRDKNFFCENLYNFIAVVVVFLRVVPMILCLRYIIVESNHFSQMMMCKQKILIKKC